MDRKYFLGIDTSNYKTSIAVVDDNSNIICDTRLFLEVKQGEKGLRQSDALFQHVKNLPLLMEEMRSCFSGHISAVSYSSKPRPVEGSYMPVFLAGEGFAKSIAAALDVPAYAFSHQEGHIEAIKNYSTFKSYDKVLSCHFSGGTTEVLQVEGNDSGYTIDIVGGSDDISLGQVIDRTGVLMGYPFPSGEYLDKIAIETLGTSNKLTAIKVKGCRFNLSGIDTQIKRLIESNEGDDRLIKEMFDKLSDAVIKVISQSCEKTGLNAVIMAGGVLSSRYLKSILEHELSNLGIDTAFDNNGLSQDNAVGIALLGGKQYGIETNQGITT